MGNAWDTKLIPKCNTKTWLEVSDKSGGRYNANKRMKFQISMLWSDLYDFSNSYNVVKGTITAYAKRR